MWATGTTVREMGTDEAKYGVHKVRKERRGHGKNVILGEYVELCVQLLFYGYGDLDS